MPHNRPRASFQPALSVGRAVVFLTLMVGLAILVMRSGAIETLNASGILGR